jgi:hypothetical protein
MCASSGAETASLPENLSIHSRCFCGVRVAQSYVFCVMFIRSLFVLFFFCRPLYCVRFELWLLVTPLVQQQSTLERPIDCMNTMWTLTVDILDELYSEFIPSRCKFRRECGNDDYEYTICCSRCCCLMVFNATFNNIPVISWRSVFFWWRKPEYPEKTTDLS